MKKSVAVLGLGKFGSSVARALTKGGAEVLAVDKNEDLVREIADEVTCTVCVDVSDKEMMNNIGLEGMDAVVIATAEHLDASVMALMIVKEIGVPYVLVKADGTLMLLQLKEMQVLTEHQIQHSQSMNKIILY